MHSNLPKYAINFFNMNVQTHQNAIIPQNLNHLFARNFEFKTLETLKFKR